MGMCVADIVARWSACFCLQKSAVLDRRKRWTSCCRWLGHRNRTRCCSSSGCQDSVLTTS